MTGNVLPPKTADRPWQFSLRQLLLATGGVCVVGAGYQWFGMGAVVLATLVLVVSLLGVAVAKWRVMELVAAVIIMCLLGALLLPTVQTASGCSRRSQCRHNLKQIGLALQNYHDTYKSFPPAYVADANGKPMHSWRVLLLPFLEQQNLYYRYRFDEPWDGPNNRLLSAEIPHIFRCPSEANSFETETSYLAVVGPETIWPGEKAISMGDIGDGTSNTLIVVESHDSGIHWMEPRDFHTLQMPMTINSPHGQGICTCHGSQDKSGRSALVQFLRADGSVGQLERDTPPATLRALLTIDGGEQVELP